MRFPVAVAGLLIGFTPLRFLAQVEGEGAINNNNVRQPTARQTIVQVEHQTHKPVGAIVTFTLPNEGAGGAVAATRTGSSNANSTAALITISLGGSTIGASR